MKKRTLSVCAIITLLMHSAFISCGSPAEHDAIFAVDYIKYDVVGSKDFGFDICVLIQNADAEMELTGVIGENVEGVTVEMIDDTYNSIRNASNKGYFLRILGFLCSLEDARSVVITGVNLKIDGIEHSVTFTNPLKHTLRDPMPIEVAYMTYPIVISTDSIKTMYTYSYIINSSVEIIGFGFNDFFEIGNSIISIDEEELGNMREVLPLKVNPEDWFAIDCSLTRTDDSHSVFDWIYCDFVITYSAGDEIKSIHGNIVVQGIGNKQDAMTFIDEILKK